MRVVVAVTCACSREEIGPVMCPPGDMFHFEVIALHLDAESFHNARRFLQANVVHDASVRPKSERAPFEVHSEVRYTKRGCCSFQDRAIGVLHRFDFR